MGTLQAEVPNSGYYAGLISCQVACPVHTDARGYVTAIAAGRFEEAYLIARGPNPFASICGRICGAPCEAACRRGKVPRVDDDGHFVGTDRPIAIRALKRFACESAGPESGPTEEILRAVQSYVPRVAAEADEMAALLRAGIDGSIPKGAGERIAIIGAGPAGLSAAHDLALLGFRPVVYETEPVPAGMLAVGVPAYRLPREVIAQEVAVIQALGVEVRCGVTVGEEISFGDLRRDYAAVVVAVGAKSSRGLALAGESGPGVYGGVDLLRAVALGAGMDIGREVVVVGGGNVAYDVARTVVRQIAFDTARTAARLPGAARVRLVSLEELEEMPADTLEIIEGDEEGIERWNGWGPVEIERDAGGKVTGVVFRKCLRVYDENRRFSPVFDDAQRQTLACDTVLLAVGQSPQLDFLKDDGGDVEMARPGWPKIDPATLATSAEGVFAAGDLAHGTRLLIDAVASGKAAARSVYRYLTGHELRPETVTAHLALEHYGRERGYEAIRRQPVPSCGPERRLAQPDVLVEIGYGPEQAMREASRCLDCGVTPVFDGNRCVLCGGCVDVCPTLCLKLVPLSGLVGDETLEAAIRVSLGAGADPEENSAILKDEDRCIRCALCAARCPVDAISMERVTFQTSWRRS
ncbi:MAG: 4Fe-4S dicluster domain-containing protein [Acidobacteria bacterium]|nr:4Fe-4S dicluster domain-containing protein [Acidobacteriota bacterium]